MSVRTPRLSPERPRLPGCLFCEQPGNLVLDPDEEAYHAIKNVADERQDATRDKFYFLYNASLSSQCFSWHVKCATAYVCFDDNKHKGRPQPQIYPKIEIKDEKEEDVKVKLEVDDEVSDIKEVPYFKSRGVPSEEIVRCLICDKILNLIHRQDHSFKSRLSAAKLIYETAHRKHDSVFIKIHRYHSPEDMIDKGMHYHKECYIKYVEPKKSGSGKISTNDIYKGWKKLLGEIADKLTTNCYELSFLAKRMAILTEVKDAIIEPETVKGLLIDNYGDKLLFSYPAGLESCVVFLSSVPLGEAMRRLQ